MIESQEECGSERGLTMHDELFSSGRENKHWVLLPSCGRYCHMFIIVFFLLSSFATLDIKHINPHPHMFMYDIYWSGIPGGLNTVFICLCSGSKRPEQEEEGREEAGVFRELRVKC